MAYLIVSRQRPRPDFSVREFLVRKPTYSRLLASLVFSRLSSDCAPSPERDRSDLGALPTANLTAIDERMLSIP
jgi:hypothetical protein